MASVQFLNGRRYSHSSVETTILKATGQSELFIDIDAIDYADHLEIALVRGTNQGILGFTAGDYTPDDCTISMGKSTFQTGIVDALGHGWMGTDISITLAYSAPGEPLTTDVIRGILKGVTDSSKQGPDPNRAVIAIQVAWISRNGWLPLQNMIT